MATNKAPKKFVEKKDVKTEQQLLIQATINSNYSLLIPCYDGNFIYVRNPITSQIKHFQTNSSELVSYIKELAVLGLGNKIEKDFNDLESKDTNWSSVVSLLKEQKAFEVIV